MNKLAQMAEAMLGFRAAPKPHMHFHAPNCTRIETSACPRRLRSWSRFGWNTNPSQNELINRRMVADKWRARAFPDWPLMAVLVQHAEGQRDLILHKYVWHLNDDTIKAVYTAYIMFTCWGCCVFGSTKDPYYDSEEYRADGGDGTGHWVYEKQEDIEESSRAELWREELIEEIEQKVGGLRELEEASKEEELVK